MFSPLPRFAFSIHIIVLGQIPQPSCPGQSSWSRYFKSAIAVRTSRNTILLWSVESSTPLQKSHKRDEPIGERRVYRQQQTKLQARVNLCGEFSLHIWADVGSILLYWASNEVGSLLDGSTAEVTRPLTQKHNRNFSRLWISRKTIIKFLFPNSGGGNTVGRCLAYITLLVGRNACSTQLGAHTDSKNTECNPQI